MPERFSWNRETGPLRLTTRRHAPTDLGTHRRARLSHHARQGTARRDARHGVGWNGSRRQRADGPAPDRRHGRPGRQSRWLGGLGGLLGGVLGGGDRVAAGPVAGGG